MIFSKIVVAFDSKTMKIAGYNVLTSILFLACGLLFAYLVRILTPVPKKWKGGSVAASIWSNCGDIPMAYVMTITQSQPFSTDDEDKGIAYVSIISSVIVVFMFAGGGIHLIESDFKVIDDDTDEEEKIGDKLSDEKGNQVQKYLHKKGSKFSKKLWHGKKQDTSKPEEEITARSFLTSGSKNSQLDVPPPALVVNHHDAGAGAELTIPEDVPQQLLRLRRKHTDMTRIDDYVEGNDEDDNEDDEDGLNLDPVVSAVAMEVEGRRNPSHSRVLTRIVIVLKNLYRPPAAALIVSIVIAVIDPVKRLFVQTSYQMRNAPDGQPPLDFIMDFTEFVGQASVPLGLMMLGTMIGRLKVTHIPAGFWKVVALTTVFKLVVLPVITLAWADRLRRAGQVPSDNLILFFVWAVCSATPSATTQVYLTSFFAPEDEDELVQMDCLAAMLISQYVTLVLTLAILVTYTLMVFI
ncbi:auxin efflux carrier [Lipomyces japonicus]|uniref:auxin efflux carrier n=1 Tax=Lipomyces japonicus TaxID=56871 RepID=UPI0034CE24DF